MIFDFRVFLGQSFDGTQQSVAELLQVMDSLKIDMALACPLKPLSYDLDQANADLARSIKPHPDRLVGAARIDPWQPDASDSLRRSLEDYGLRALYLNPWEENFRADLEMLEPLLAIVETHRLPVLMTTGYPWLSEALQVSKLARRWPNVAVVMTNGGQINISGLGQADATLALRQSPNLYIDTAGIYRQDFIEETVEEFGAARVLFGSGAPYFDQRYEIKRVLWAKVDEAARQAMLGGNARQLLGLQS
jgi:predicted TIM-barrel fold metal-dependent hydrolase